MTFLMITCMNCGTDGEVGTYRLPDNARPGRIFRHLGHNPFSGQMHYQCPACKGVLLVDPMTILENIMLPTVARRHPARELKDCRPLICH